MNRAIFLLVVTLLIFSSGCGQKAEQQTFEETLPGEAMQTQQPQGQVSVVTPTEQPQTVEKAPASTVTISETTAVSEVTPTFVKPTVKEVQQALKNAGFYQGNIDGIAGPGTKKAIEDFQAQKSLNVDGKVGPKTWAQLQPFLSQAQTQEQ